MKVEKQLTDVITLNLLTSRASDLRGTIIEYFTIIESLMDNIIRISSQKSDDPAYQLINSFSDKFTLLQKQQALKYCILKFEEKYSYKRTFDYDKLIQAINLRNVLAHWLLDTTEKRIKLFREKQILTFNKDVGKKIKVERKEYSITMKQAAKILKNISDAINELLIINNKLVGKGIVE